MLVGQVFERYLELYLSNKWLINSKSSRSALPNLYYLGQNENKAISKTEQLKAYSEFRLFQFLD